MIDTLIQKLREQAEEMGLDSGEVMPILAVLLEDNTSETADELVSDGYHPDIINAVADAVETARVEVLA